MDYTQRHQAAMDAVNPNHGINVDVAMKIPNFSLMERFLVIGGNDPNLFYKNIMKIIYPTNRKKSVNPVELLKYEIEYRMQFSERKEDSEGIFGLFKEVISNDTNEVGNWFERTEANCGAINLPRTSKELYEVMNTRHLNFFESLIQANIRKEAESIPLMAFEFWTEKEVKKAFEKELLKFLYNDQTSEIEGYEKGIIMLMIAMIRLKKEIDLMPTHQRKEDFFDRKLINLKSLPIEDQREHLIHEQKDILISVNLTDDYIIDLIRKDLEEDDFEVETRFYRSRKNIIKTYKALQVLVERKFEIFMNLILFRNVISKFWTEDMNNEIILLLVRAGMVLTNIRIWKDFINARDSGLVPVGAALCRPISSKPTLESSKSSKTVSESKPETKELKRKNMQAQAIQSKEVIEISSDSEKELSEPKKSEVSAWKQRAPKRCSKYIPEEPEYKKKLASEGWLTKRISSDGLNFPNAIGPFRKELSSKDAGPFERDNQREAISVSKVSSIVTKRSSSAIMSSHQVSNPTSVSSTYQHFSGKELRPRIMQEALSKL